MLSAPLKAASYHEMRPFFHQDEAAIVVNMSADDLQQKYDGNLNSEMIGPLHNLIAKVSL